MSKYWWKYVELALFKAIYPIKTLHKERVPDGRCVIACNHLRAIDPCFLHDVYLTDVNIIAKKEIFKNKFIAKFVGMYGALPVDRENPSLASLLSFVKVLKNERKLFIFPEGTRNFEGTKLRNIKSGAGAIAVMGKAPVVPVIIYEHERAFRKTYMLVGDPIDLSKYYGVKMNKEVQDEIDEVIYKSMQKVQSELDEYMLKTKKRKRFDDKKRSVRIKCK